MNPTPEQQQDTVTWAPKRGLGFKLMVWAILLGFGLCVLLGAVLLVMNFFR